MVAEHERSDQFRTYSQLITLFNMHTKRYEREMGGRVFPNCCIRCDDPVDLEAFTGHLPDLCTQQELIVEILMRRGVNSPFVRVIKDKNPDDNNKGDSPCTNDS